MESQIFQNISDNDTKEFTSWDLNESIIFNNDYSWVNLDDDKKVQIDDEWSKPINTQINENWSWKPEILNKTRGLDQNDDYDEWLKSITTNNEEVNQIDEKQTRNFKILNEQTETEKIDPN